MPTLEDDRLVFRFPEIDPDAAFAIDFQRTLRIPDTDRDYPLPPGFGRFPLRHVEDHGSLPERTRARGGVILPIWQSEALWLNFDGPRAARLPVAIKVAAGKINAVTGETWSAPLNRSPQDYMVWPEQPWLDGFAVEKGVIRQFVAMPLGDGYSVEEQLTGSAEWGGLQISVTPLRKQVWDRMNLTVSRRSWALKACEPMCDMGLGAGGRMQQDIDADPHDLEDWDQRATQRVFVTLQPAEHWHATTGETVPTAPPTAQAYAAAGLPWFKRYGSGRMALPGSDRLAGVSSVGKLHAEKLGTPLPHSGEVEPGTPVRVDGIDGGPRVVKPSTVW
jgi:hypothetical protein